MGRLYDISELEADVFSEEERHEMYEDETYEDDLIVEADTEFPALELELELEDGQVLVCEAVGVFLAGDYEYMALHPKTDTEGIVHLMRLEPGEDDELKLSPIKDEEELQVAAEAFQQMLEDGELESDSMTKQ